MTNVVDYQCYYNDFTSMNNAYESTGMQNLYLLLYIIAGSPTVLCGIMYDCVHAYTGIVY